MVDWVSRRVFGNTWHFRRNLRDMTAWAKLRRGFRGEVDPIVHAFYRRLGYYPLPHGSIEPDVLQRVKTRFAAVIEDPAHASNPFAEDPELYKTYNHGGLEGDAPMFRLDLRNAAASMPDAFQIFGPKLINSLRSALGCEFEVERMSAHRNFHVPLEIREKFEAGSDRWHFDDHGSDRLRLFMLVSDVTPDDGPTSFFDRQYSKYLMLQGFDSNKRGESETSGIPPHLLRDNPHMIRHTGVSGALVATQTSNCLHRAGTRGPGKVRDMIIFTVRASANLVIPTITSPGPVSSTADGFITSAADGAASRQ